jgi:transposase
MKRLADPNVVACAPQGLDALKAQKEQPAMEYGAIDLHTKESEIRIVTAEGAVVLHRRIATTRAALTSVFGGRPRLRILVESGTESEWVAQHLEACGHAVVVADPNYAPMYGQRTRRIQTDTRDVIALAEANRLAIYRAAHRVSSAQRTVRRQLQVRDQLVRMRTQVINLMRGQLRSEGLRVRSGRAESFVTRYQALEVPAALRAVLAPLVEALTALEPMIAAADAWAKQAARADVVTRRLMTAPGVGPITALSFQSALDTFTRFRGPGAVSAYLGVVPPEDSSGDRQRRGRITKAGPPRIRGVLVQASWAVWRSPRSSATLHAWVHRLADRRGKRIAIVALARRLARILFAMWRDGRDYQPARVGRAAVAA